MFIANDVSAVRPPTPPTTPPPTASIPSPLDQETPTAKNDPISLSYNWKTQTFSYKKLSKIDQKDATRIQILKGVKDVEVRPRVDTNKHKKVLLVRMVTLPRRAILGRKLGMFDILWVEGKVE